MQGSHYAPSLHAVGAHCWVGVPPLPSPPRRPLVLSARGCSGGGASPPSPCRPCPPPRSRSSGYCPPLPSALLCRLTRGPSPPSAPSVVFAAAFLLLGVLSPLPIVVLPLATAPASLSQGLLPARPEPLLWGVLESNWSRYSLLLGWRSPCQLGLPPPRPKPRRWGVLPGAPCLRLPSLSSPQAPRSPLPPRPVAPLRCRHWSAVPGLVGLRVGLCPLPFARVCPPPTGIGTLWGIPGFCLPRGPRLLWGSSHPMTTRLPLHLSV